MREHFFKDLAMRAYFAVSVGGALLGLQAFFYASIIGLFAWLFLDLAYRVPQIRAWLASHKSARGEHA